jgi:PAS domain-containing protein
MCNSEDYKIFFDDAPVALVRTNLKTGCFEMANNYAARLFGCDSVEDLIENHKSTDFYPAATRAKLIKILRKQGTVEDHELQLELPNGSTIWVSANFRINCGGECIECFLTDITELVCLREKTFIHMKSVSEKLDTRIAALAS